jgi:hypothetical protein
MPGAAALSPILHNGLTTTVVSVPLRISSEIAVWFHIFPAMLQIQTHLERISYILYLCHQTSGKINGFAKFARQQPESSLLREREPSPDPPLLSVLDHGG